MPLNLPIQTVVDRSVQLSYATVDQEVRNRDGQLIQILRNPVDGPFGAEPGDPAWFPRHINPRVAVCQILSSYAAARCLQGRGYF
jgi:hypothetical protein